MSMPSHWHQRPIAHCPLPVAVVGMAPTSRQLPVECCRVFPYEPSRVANRWGLRLLEASDSLLLTGGKRSVGCSRSILQSPSALSWPSFSGHCEVEWRFHAAAATTQSAYASCASS